jgi:hypothetical protein
MKEKMIVPKIVGITRVIIFYSLSLIPDRICPLPVEFGIHLGNSLLVGKILRISWFLSFGICVRGGRSYLSRMGFVRQKGQDCRKDNNPQLYIYYFY